MPERFHKLCLIVPIERFEGLLPDSELYAGTHFKAGTNLAKLLGACLRTLADNVLPSDEEPGDAALEVTLEMLGAAMQRTRNRWAKILERAYSSGFGYSSKKDSMIRICLPPRLPGHTAFRFDICICFSANVV
jgi:hypothetical protein